MNTAEQFDAVLSKCHGLFEKKGKDYGTAWRILRLPSLTDQIFIKAQRLRSIEQKGEQLVDDPLEGEFIGILNYSIMALIQLDKGIAEQPDMDWEEAEQVIDELVRKKSNIIFLLEYFMCLVGRLYFHFLYLRLRSVSWKA